MNLALELVERVRLGAPALDKPVERRALGGGSVDGGLVPKTLGETLGKTTLGDWRKLLESARGWGVGAEFTELSMGMSGDFEVGIEEGATIVRVGTAIFGPRGDRP